MDENTADGRPINTDLFLAKLFEDCDDYFDLRQAIKAWCEGDRLEAMGYIIGYEHPND